MSSAQAVSSAASGIARRSRVRTADGLRRNSFRSTPPLPQDAAAGSLHLKTSQAAAAAGLAAPRLVRCRSLTSAPEIGRNSSRSYSSIARLTSAARQGGGGGGSGSGGDWCNDKVGCGGLVAATAAAAAARHTTPLLRCRSLTSAPSMGGGIGGSSRSYTSAARIASAARGGDGNGDLCHDKTGFGGAGASGAEGGGFIAGALALTAALAASPRDDETNWGNDRMGRGSSAASWGDDRVGGGGGGGSKVWCDGASASTTRLPSSLGSFREQAARGAESQQTKNIFARNSSSSSSGGSSDSDVKQMEIDGLRSGSFEPTSSSAPATSSARLITDVYRFQGTNDEVGRGQRSVVSTATHRLTGQAVAVKRLARTDTTRMEVMEEVNMLKVAGTHPNVVSLQAFFEDQDAYYIVMEMCEGGELYHRLADKGRYSEGQAARIMAEVASAVSFLHRNAIVHFDLKPENIMLAVGGDDCVPEVRLADFGSAFRQYQQISTARDYTAAYSAPEVLAHQPVDEKVDMWALGVVMWVLLTGQHPFGANSDLSEAEVARRVAEVEPDQKVLRHVSSEGKDLVRRLLARDPEDRPSALQMLSHPWLRAVITRAKAKTIRRNTLRGGPVRRADRRQQQQPPVGVGAGWGVTLQRDVTAGDDGGGGGTRGGDGAEPAEQRQQAIV
ncbi:unnamed protein product [Pylaiella littoralis]